VGGETGLKRTKQAAKMSSVIVHSGGGITQKPVKVKNGVKESTIYSPVGGEVPEAEKEPLFSKKMILT